MDHNQARFGAGATEEPEFGLGAIWSLSVPTETADPLHMQKNTPDRRADARLLCADLVQLIWQDSSGRQRRRVANLEDISLSGVCLQVEASLPEGTPITIQYGDGSLVGTVRYCVFRDSGYFLGVQLEDGCKWSSQHYRPQHLVDPRDLVDLAMQRRGVSTKVTQ